MKEFYEKWEIIKDDLEKNMNELCEMTGYTIHLTFKLELETKNGFKKELPERNWAWFSKEKDKDE